MTIVINQFMPKINPRNIFYQFLTILSLFVSLAFFSFPSQGLAYQVSSVKNLPSVIFSAAKRKAAPVALPPFDIASRDKSSDGSTTKISIPDLGVSAPLIYSNTSDIQSADWNCLKDVRSCPMRFLLRYGILHISGTPDPGQLGNSILVGHSSCYTKTETVNGRTTEYCKVLEKINTLRIGSKFEINSSNGKKQTFEIVDSFRFYYSRAAKLAKLSDQVNSMQNKVDSAKNARTKNSYQKQLNSLQAQYDKLNNGANFDKRNAKHPNERIVTLETCWPLGTASDRWVVQAKLVDETPANPNN